MVYFLMDKDGGIEQSKIFIQSFSYSFLINLKT